MDVPTPPEVPLGTPVGTPLGTPRGYAKGYARREAIVAVAIEFFARTGYQGATMLQIAAACGISRAGLLHHFPTKESLLEAVLSHRDERDGRWLRSQTIDAHDPLAPLAGLVRLVAHNATVPAIVNLYAVLSAEAGAPGHPAHGYFVSRYARSRADITAQFARAGSAGLLVAGADPADLAVDLIALMDGLQVQWLLDPGRIDMATAVRRRIESALTVPLSIPG